MIRLSAGTAAALGLRKIRMDVSYNSLPFLRKRMHRKMRFAPKPREAGGKNQLGRISWPVVAWEEILTAMPQAADNGLKRVCMQSVRQNKNLKAFLETLQKIKDVSNLPLSVSMWINNKKEAAEIFAAGADRLSIALDAVNPGIYSCVRAAIWQTHRPSFRVCTSLAGAYEPHLICGLGKRKKKS